MADIVVMEDGDTRIAEGAESEPTQAGEKPAPSRVRVNLGEQVVEVDDPDQARVIKSAFDRLHGQYGSELERLRREAFSSMGTTRTPDPEPTTRTQAPDFVVPDPDLMFTNKQAWGDGLRHSLENRLSVLEQRNEALVRAAVDTIQDELAQREERAQLQALFREHDARMYESRPELKKAGRAFVAAVYDEEKENLRHLPVNVAFERLGEIAEARYKEVRGEPATPARRAPAAPNLLSSARRGAPPATAQEPARMSISDRIWQRREAMLKGK